MSYRRGDTAFLVEEEGQHCELCGAFAELRPYGPGGKRICYDCGMKPKNKQKADWHVNELLKDAKVAVHVKLPPKQ